MAGELVEHGEIDIYVVHEVDVPHDAVLELESGEVGGPGGNEVDVDGGNQGVQNDPVGDVEENLGAQNDPEVDEVNAEVDGVDLDGLKEEFADGCAYFEDAEKDNSGDEDPEVSEARGEFRSVRDRFLEELEKRDFRLPGYVPIDPDEAGPTNVEPYDEPYYSTDECGEQAAATAQVNYFGNLGIGTASFSAQFSTDNASGSTGNATVNLTSADHPMQPASIPENEDAKSKAAAKGKAKAVPKGKGKPPKTKQQRVVGRVTLDDNGRILSSTEPQFRTSPKSMEKMFNSRQGGAGSSFSTPMTTASPGWLETLRSSSSKVPESTSKKRSRKEGQGLQGYGVYTDERTGTMIQDAGQPFQKLIKVGKKTKKAAKEPHGTQESNNSTISSLGTKKAPWKP
ncbi:hypothetical protein COLO4_03613 [Corchorus olitorius]|uniref:Uncharacterized protein n=1 Tax=Corchorus olitorius TaxID=93759 RepID=A0A1R3KXX2_9ROSI|nr:hypothetical protein COLO4_03613 [Corchorus olitorius]